MKPLATAAAVAVAVAVTAAVIWVVAALTPPALLDALSKLGPVATGLVAVFALIVGIITIRQKQGADAETAEAERRDQWWTRAQWAIDRLYEPPEERQVVAWRILRRLAESNLAGDEELAIFDAVAERRLNQITITDDDSDRDPVVGNTGDEQEGSATVSEKAVERPSTTGAATKAKPSAIDVEAAQLKVVVDRRLGQTTPDWVLRVAQGLPPVAPAS